LGKGWGLNFANYKFEDEVVSNLPAILYLLSRNFRIKNTPLEYSTRKNKKGRRWA